MQLSALFCSPLFLLSISFGHFSSTVNAQNFRWKFTHNLNTQLASCQSLAITVEPVNSTNNKVHPPFYMIAWEIGGTPRTTLLGLHESHLEWTVGHPIGTSLMLNVVDSMGNGGGIHPRPYVVETAHTTNCIMSETNNFTVTANVTGTISTCQPWGLKIRGGNPPYNISFAQFGSPVVMNVTIPAPLDTFTFINRATPGPEFLLLAAVSDASGRYAFGTPTVIPKGSQDVSCIGLTSSPGTLARQTPQANAKPKPTAILAGVLTPLLVLLFGGTAYWIYRHYTRQRKTRLELEPEPMMLPEPKDVEEAAFHTESQVLDIPGLNPSLNPFVTEAERGLIVPSANGWDGQSAASNSRLNSGSSQRGSSNFRTIFVRQPNKKAIGEGLVVNQPSSSSKHVLASAASVPVSSLVRVQSASLSAPADPHGNVPEFIIQHQDAGRFVRELPPPYKERNSRSLFPWF